MHTRICEDCGQEVLTGIINAIEHVEKCPRDAPNSSLEAREWRLEAEKRDREYKKRKKRRDERLWRIWPKMTPDEQANLLCLSVNGWVDGYIVYMGLEALQKLQSYEDHLLKKYPL